MRGGANRPLFLDSRDMKSKKVTKAMIADQVMALQAYIDEWEAFDASVAMVEKADPRAIGLSDQWFGVAYIGWGTWQEDVYFVEAATPVDAIGEFEDAIENGDFEGHGYNLPNDRSLYPSTDERILVYEIKEYAEYRKTKWEKV